MTLVSLIAAVDQNNGLGLNNQLLCHLPADLKYFKETTMGKPIIMGRKTYQSIGKPLPGRRNIIISRHFKTNDNIDVVSSIEQAIHLTKEKEIMIIGGESIYRQSIDLANRIYLTVIHHKFKADVHFPLLDETEWNCVSEVFLKKDDKNIYDLTFKTFDRI